MLLRKIQGSLAQKQMNTECSQSMRVLNFVKAIIQTFSILGIIISKSYGLAKKATAIAVRVLNAGGSGSFA